MSSFKDDRLKGKNEEIILEIYKRLENNNDIKYHFNKFHDINLDENISDIVDQIFKHIEKKE